MPSHTSIPAGDLQATARRLPKSLLYSIAAGIGGSGLDAVALETLRGAKPFLGRAVAFSSDQKDIPVDRITTLDIHPVKLLSLLSRQHYMGAKKHAIDAIAARLLTRGGFDFLHSWSGDCLESLRVANRRNIPSVLEIPTWHRNKGKVKPNVTKSERERAAAGFPHSVFNRMLVSRQQVMEEYDRATLIFVLSEKARETFRIAGIPDEKLFTMHRGVDVDRFTPAERLPDKFRAVFLGAVIKRKGVHILLEAWRKAALPEAELILIGQVQPEMESFLKQYGGDDVKVAGFTRDVPGLLRQASLHVFPSELEGSAKATYEAAACGLAQIATRESGDVVIDGKNGWIIPPNDVDALVEALHAAHADHDRLLRYGKAGRERVVNHFTWDHFRERLLDAYDLAIRRTQ
ncbi:glycosyltransferase [Terrimicrobium sacchariphilum]|uniref:Glycosyltransferase n=1 Tax=Terrimicrobium sacchariphilum TaxID=690879 RepID=A0A146GE81_TERSA|nr:glycosyltransferase family 4 protein [Terrimicrobium sacchariphilum]GAT34994.1 glycosyltransferase [Terrimicrobium sacchariphilum]